ncbi:hypothetical protein LE181_04330 [Streptomyces sp. SCA3-4]|uniref:hypothetical protein n=1 Tax=Streptomyces sichuanensis TaxID=2871810 RepID=UPI001CE2C780|nr:hypothetical protein [Streptomyces sichuanensis]MCA6091399.1 hypothetical protein [Streptomyces sichuanensis]
MPTDVHRESDGLLDAAHRGARDMAELLRSLGFEAIPCPFQHVQSLGGSFPCATPDIRRSA